MGWFLRNRSSCLVAKETRLLLRFLRFGSEGGRTGLEVVWEGLSGGRGGGRERGEKGRLGRGWDVEIGWFQRD